MKFKGYDNFIAEQYRPLNEAKEKFKVSEAKPSHPNSQGAFTVKFVGPNFDMQTMMAFLQTDPVSAPALQKVKASPSEFFFIYKTIKGGDPRFLAPNSKIWVTYLELIDAKGPDGKQTYVGFDKPPYNNFVKWTDAENLINKQDPETVQAGKQIVAAVDQTGTQQVQNGLTDAEKSIATNTQQFMKDGQVPGQPQVTRNLNPEIAKIVDGFKGISIGSRGPKVDQLQNTIQKLADATHNINAERQNRLNVRPGGEFDDIFGVHTISALQTVLGLSQAPEVIDADVIEKIKDALAANSSITAADLTNKAQFPKIKGKVQAGKPMAQQHPTQPTQQPQQSQPAAGSVAGVEAQSTKPATRLIQDTLIGNIRY